LPKKNPKVGNGGAQPLEQYGHTVPGPILLKAAHVLANPLSNDCNLRGTDALGDRF
jgi:hypothetical protein